MRQFFTSTYCNRWPDDRWPGRSDDGKYYRSSHTCSLTDACRYFLIRLFRRGWTSKAENCQCRGWSWSWTTSRPVVLRSRDGRRTSHWLSPGLSWPLCFLFPPDRWERGSWRSPARRWLNSPTVEAHTMMSCMSRGRFSTCWGRFCLKLSGKGWRWLVPRKLQRSRSGQGRVCSGWGSWSMSDEDKCPPLFGLCLGSSQVPVTAWRLKINDLQLGKVKKLLNYPSS